MAKLPDDLEFESPAPSSNPDGVLVQGNIDLHHRPVVHNKDGSISTVRSIGVNVDGKEVLLPTVSDDGRIMSDDEAVNTYKKTGKHLGIFATPEASTRFAQQLHEDQAGEYLPKAKPQANIRGAALPPDLDFGPPRSTTPPTAVKVPEMSTPAKDESPFKATFTPGPAFKPDSQIPMVHLGGPKDPEAGAALPRAKDHSKMGRLESATVGLGHGASLGFQDEVDGALNLIPGVGKEPSLPQQAAEADAGPKGFKQWVLDKYTEGRDSSRRIRDEAAKQNPGTYATAHLAGSMLPLLATDGLAAPVEGAALGARALAAAKSGAAVGGAMGLGNSDAPLFSKDTAKAVAAGGALGAAAAGGGAVAPKLVGGAAGLAGLGMGAFGDKLDMTPSQRIESALGGGFGLAGAGAAGLLKPVANKAGVGAGAARTALAEKLLGQDATEAASLNRESDASKKAGLKLFESRLKQLQNQDEPPVTGTVNGSEVEPKKFLKGEAARLDEKEAPYWDAEIKAGEEKAKKFKNMLTAAEKARAAEQDNNAKLSAQHSKDDWAERVRETSVASKQMQRAGMAANARPGANPEDLAALEASIPQRVQGKLDADYQAVLNRYNTLKQLGQEIPPELDSQVQTIKQRYAGNSPEFFKRFLDFESKAPMYEQELRAELAAKARGTKAGGGSNYTPDTEITPPKVHDTDVKDRSKDFASAEVLKNRPGDVAKAAAELDIPFHPEANPDYAVRAPAVFEHDQAQADAHNNALKKLIGAVDKEAGDEIKDRPGRVGTLYHGDLLTRREQAKIADKVGVNPRQEMPKRPAAKLLNQRDVQAYDNFSPDGADGPKTVPIRSVSKPAGDTLPIPGKAETAGKTRSDYPESFFRGAPPEKDFADSPLSNEEWKKVAGAHIPDEQLAPDQRAASYWSKQGFSDTTPMSDPTGDGPTVMGKAISPMDLRVQDAVDAAKAPSLTTHLASKALGSTLPRMGKLGLGIANKLIDTTNKDPAGAAKLLETVQQRADLIPNFQEKYGRFLAAATNQSDLMNRLRFAESQEAGLGSTGSSDEGSRRGRR